LAADYGGTKIATDEKILKSLENKFGKVQI
jgi:hypothetical protein